MRSATNGVKLKSLQINGFKSFAKKADLEFLTPVTSIVGPNGSGKSNVVETFRFVLGEQSMKSMRGRSGTDLIFKGSKQISKLSRAEAKITFDNTDRAFKLHSDGATNLDVDFDEIIVSREVFADGANKYKINGTDVRLKDVHELLSSVHIGSSGHHIISQGQADRVLNVSPRDRRSMIEDALGLKVYQMRMKDANRKLDKTLVNMKEIESLRREIQPHIRFLKKQVDKIEKTKVMGEQLAVLYSEYLVKEESFLSSRNESLEKERNSFLNSLKAIDDKISSLGESPEPPVDTDRLEKIQKTKTEMLEIRNLKDEISRKVGKIEAMIDLETRKGVKKPQQKVEKYLRVAREDIEALVRDLSVFVDSALKKDSVEAVHSEISNIRSTVSDFSRRMLNAKEAEEEILVDEELIASLNNQKEEILKTFSSYDEKILSFESEIQKLNQEIEEGKRTYYNNQRAVLELKNEKEKLLGQLEMTNRDFEGLTERKESFEEEIREAVVLVGQKILEYKNKELDVEGSVDKVSQDESRRKIERLKIKLEDAGALGGEDVLQEYKEVTEREEFLSNELKDLSESISSLKNLIRDLKDTLDSEFKNGIEKINKQFQEFFAVMFGGGSAFLSLVTQKPRKKKKSDDEEVDLGEVLDEDEEKNFEQGIDINVKLPQKKITALGMLSGGERSLTSIALLFAMSQVNPPPFLVLDETDAALDEANSRRYGDMIEKLAKYSQLIVVTHNRETMSRAQVLYGVTIGADGGSKLLSIKFNEAKEYAK